MVSRKRSKGAKKGWQTRRYNAVKDAISRRAFDVWDKLPKSEHDTLLDFRAVVVGTTESGKDTKVREIISAKIERMGKRMAFFFDIMQVEFGLENHEIKSILFSPKPRRK